MLLTATDICWGAHEVMHCRLLPFMKSCAPSSRLISQWVGHLLHLLFLPVLVHRSLLLPLVPRYGWPTGGRMILSPSPLEMGPALLVRAELWILWGVVCYTGPTIFAAGSCIWLFPLACLVWVLYLASIWHRWDIGFVFGKHLWSCFFCFQLPLRGLFTILLVQLPSASEMGLPLSVELALDCAIHWCCCALSGIVIPFGGWACWTMGPSPRSLLYPHPRSWGMVVPVASILRVPASMMSLNSWSPGYHSSSW